jgi:hypothetical protein
MTRTSDLPEYSYALQQLLRRQVRAGVLLFVRIVACALFLTLLRPLWQATDWLANLLYSLGGLVCGVPLFRAVGANWRWRIALGKAYFKSGNLTDAERILRPVAFMPGQYFDRNQEGYQTLVLVQQQLQEAERNHA